MSGPRPPREYLLGAILCSGLEQLAASKNKADRAAAAHEVALRKKRAEDRRAAIRSAPLSELIATIADGSGTSEAAAEIDRRFPVRR